MTKKQERSELEYVRGEMRKMKSIIKDLKRQLGHNKKREHLLDDAEALLAEEMIQEEKTDNALASKNTCPKCNSKDMDIIDLGTRKVFICGCGHRMSKKK